jgi:CBS domain-containing protein
MIVSELMRTPVVTTRARETLCGAAARMRDHGIGALAIVDGADRLLGIVTERDLLRAMADGRPPRTTPVEWYASLAPVTVEPDADCATAARLMVRHEIRHVPVTRGGRVVGMLSARDLLLVEAWRREAAATLR